MTQASSSPQQKVLIFIVSYNAERFIVSVLQRIPYSKLNEQGISYDVLIIDDCSPDSTFEVAQTHNIPELQNRLTVLKNPHNLGYGGNQKIGYEYAIENEYDHVILLHGDGQYAPEEIPNLLTPLLNHQCDALFGSRMMNGFSALKGGMPLYKFFGNKILTKLENFLAGLDLSEWHSGYRLYSTQALKKIPFELNSNGFDFDSEIILQLQLAGLRIGELPIPTRYGEETCHVNGFAYAWNIIIRCIQSKIQTLGLFYSRKFDVHQPLSHYQPKFHFPSSHQTALEKLKPDSLALIFGSGRSSILESFFSKNNSIISVDSAEIPLPHHPKAESHTYQDQSGFLETIIKDRKIDQIFLLDYIEHVESPESLLEKIRHSNGLENTSMLISTPNVAFFITRLMLFFGQFNYGRKGILDKSHKRLFTFKSLKNLLEEQGFDVVSISGLPAPFPLALKNHPRLAQFLVKLNMLAISFRKELFSYQILIQTKPHPTLKQLLSQSVSHTHDLCHKA